ncbi:MAG TPA: hypothetical protein VF145_03830, partial [Chitinophagaceae bacterium]
EHARRLKGKAILDTLREEGMNIVFANHSYSHAGHNHYESFYHSPAKALADFLRIQDSLHFVEPIIRFPGNNSWVVSSRIRTTRSTRRLAKLMDSVGYNVMGWDVEWRFNQKNKPVQSAEEMARQVENAFHSNNSMVKNHVVLLTHDRMFSEPATRDSLAKMIALLQGEKGYVFRSANEYPALKKIDRRIIAMRK